MGTPFEIDSSIESLDKFLLDRINSKLAYWTSQRLLVAGRAMIVKQVLLSSLWYFTSIWHGSVKVLGKIKGLLRNYLWSGMEYASRARVSWSDCCVKRKAGGLSLLDPQEATTTLLCKWIINAYGPGESNLKIILRSKLWSCSPCKESKWSTNLQWGLGEGHTSVPGFKAWGKIHVAWTKLNKRLNTSPPYSSN